MGLEIRLLPLRDDNYAYLMRDESDGTVAVVDPSDAEPVLTALETIGWKPAIILNTHHHDDHTAGNQGIAKVTGATVLAPESERAKIAHTDRGLADGESFTIGGTSFTSIETPGHTLGQLSYYSAEAKALFSGDTLFSLGCGRVFEGTPQQMWTSLLKLRALPDDTLIYCGHEYTKSNCKFALSIEPENAALQARAAEIDRLRAEGKPTVPTTIGQEKATNPFFRADDPGVQASLGMTGADPAEVFARLRAGKDTFR